MQEVIVLYNPFNQMYISWIYKSKKYRQVRYNILPANGLMFDPAGDWPKIKKRLDALTGIDLIPKTIKV